MKLFTIANYVKKVIISTEKMSSEMIERNRRVKKKRSMM